MPGPRWALGLAGALLALTPPLPCRYTVREVGFVDLTTQPYRLWVRAGSPSDSEYRDAMARVAATTFVDSNVVPQLVTPAVDLPAGVRSVLDAAPAAEAHAVLEAPDGRTLPLPMPTSAAALEQAGHSGELHAVLSSGVRETLLARLVEAFCVVLVLEGPDAAENDRVDTAVAGAFEDFDRERLRLPKPVFDGPEVVKVSRESMAQEQVLLFGLGLPSEPPPSATVALLYGRGQRMGPLLRGAAITRPAVASGLLLVGQSCECGLDRRWMLGDRLPLKWDETRQQQVVRTLGFDAENPLVKAEISRILAQGPGGLGGAVAAPSFEELLLGYSEEVVIDPIPLEEPATDPVPMQSAGGAREIPDEQASAADPVEIPVAWLITMSILGICAISGIGGTVVVLRSRRREP